MKHAQRALAVLVLAGAFGITAELFFVAGAGTPALEERHDAMERRALAPGGLPQRGKSTATMLAPFGPVAAFDVAHAGTPPLRDLPANPPALPRRVEADVENMRPGKPVPREYVDPARKPLREPKAPPAPTASFEGQTTNDSGCNCIPPDTNGAVGKDQYVQMVNGSIAVYSKTGAVKMAAKHTNALFTALPATSQCRIRNDGDPVVMYDQFADRWMISQFTYDNTGGVGYHECIGVSKTPDATGEYWVYDFQVGTTVFHDYPHFGLWRDGYYMATHEFDDNNGYSGSGAFAFERDKMLTGAPAQVVFFDMGKVNSGFFGHLPASIDGPNLPPAGMPELFAEIDADGEIDAGNALRIWKFKVDWATPANSTFGVAGAPNFKLPVDTFMRPTCVLRTGNCVPQPASQTELDSIGDRLMFRLAYRNFGDHESMVLNHTVIGDGNTLAQTPRWYEVRNLSTTPTIYQTGTLPPSSNTDQLYRWMGSIAQDSKGSIAVAYSTSSASDYPSIAYSGHLASDPVGEMAQGERQLFAGSGQENPYLFVGAGIGRWGDYSDLTVDPLDDRTFWYTTEYFPSAAADPAGHVETIWHTRIVSFKLPDPVVTGNQPPVATLAAAPTSGVAPLDVTFTVTGTDPNAGDTLTYDMDFGDSSAHATTSGAVPHTYSSPGTYTATLKVTDNHAASDTKTVTITANANNAPTASLTPASVSKHAGQSVTYTVAGTDPDAGDTLSYDLDFGDGAAHSTASGAVLHTYATAGSYTATLTVTDTHSASDSKTASVTILPPLPPFGVTLTSDKSGGDLQSGPVRVVFTAHPANDDGSALSYRFTFGDGTAAITQPAATAVHQYASAGTFHAVVTATQASDNKTAISGADEDIVTITLVPNIGNNGVGAFGAFTLLPLAALAALRRRRFEKKG